jgi:hypothetical protein
MAGITQKPVTSGVNWGGVTDLGNGLMLYVGVGVFVTSGTSVTIYHPFGTGEIYHAEATPIFATAAQAANGQLTISGGTIDTSTYGSFKATTAGQASVKRIAGTDSALSFSVLMIGRAKH